MHADTTQRLVDESVDLSQRLPDGHLDAARAKDGGLDAQFFSIWVEPELFGGGGPRAIKRADIQIEAVQALAAQAVAKLEAQRRSLVSHLVRSALAGMYVGAAIVLIFTIGGSLAAAAPGAVPR